MRIKFIMIGLSIILGCLLGYSFNSKGAPQLESITVNRGQCEAWATLSHLHGGKVYVCTNETGLTCMVHDNGGIWCMH